jgi:hypothetical protein
LRHASTGWQGKPIRALGAMILGHVTHKVKPC